MYLLWNSQLFSVYQPAEAMTLGTAVGLFYLYSSSALLTYILASCEAQGFPVSYGSTLWEGRKSQTNLFCSEIPLSHLLLLVWTQLWSSGFHPEKGQCARPLFRSSQHEDLQTYLLSKWWEKCSSSHLEVSCSGSICSDSSRIWPLIKPNLQNLQKHSTPPTKGLCLLMS